MLVQGKVFMGKFESEFRFRPFHLRPNIVAYRDALVLVYPTSDAPMPEALAAEALNRYLSRGVWYGRHKWV